MNFANIRADWSSGNLVFIDRATGSTILTITSAGALTPASDITLANGKQLIPDGSTASATAGAATLSKQSGVVTSEALTTAAGAAYTLTLTNTLIAATSIILVSFCNGTNTQGTLELGLVTPGSGSATIVIRNSHGSEALNGTIKISFLVLNPA